MFVYSRHTSAPTALRCVNCFPKGHPDRMVTSIVDALRSKFGRRLPNFGMENTAFLRFGIVDPRSTTKHKGRSRRRSLPEQKLLTVDLKSPWLACGFHTSGVSHA